ncbi:unnamed protein product [Mytilus edulis]|uniref:Transmembrane protein 179 n=1 Tax=Mytilus edulis TaxID=6550 RepID=A0A8S3T2M2_MYTED|nr:unnamed protein product [Mytilus edulis]
MGLGNILLLTQVVAYLVSFIVSFFIFIPIATNVKEFNGHCLLYADGTFDNKTKELKHISWGRDSACGFNIFMGVIVMLLSLFYMVWESVYLFKNIDGSWLDCFVTALVSLLVCLMLFGSSLTLSVGFNEWCGLISNEGINCELGDFVTFIEEKDINTSNFYLEMMMAQFCTWICWICWVVLSVVAVIKVYRYHQQESFTISMNRERDRLLQRAGHRQPVVM